MLTILSSKISIRIDYQIELTLINEKSAGEALLLRLWGSAVQRFCSFVDGGRGNAHVVLDMGGGVWYDVRAWSVRNYMAYTMGTSLFCAVA